MRAQTFERRLERAEHAAKTQSKFSTDCICFPETSHRSSDFAAKVKCALHGDRFEPRLYSYVPRWRRENEKKVRWFRLSPQYHKAWHAGFPPDLWPAEEEESEDRTVVLKDGTRLLAYEPVYDRPSTGKIVSGNIYRKSR
jgi:hypothetical protein